MIFLVMLERANFTWQCFEKLHFQVGNEYWNHRAKNLPLAPQAFSYYQRQHENNFFPSK